MQDLMIENFPSTPISIHPSILHMLFTHKSEIISKLRDIKGAYSIDHFSIKIIDIYSYISVFSTTPSLEYNLLMHGQWKFDKSFDCRSLIADSIYTWEDCFDTSKKPQLISKTLQEYGLSYGLHLSRKLDVHNIVYSFGFKNPHKDPTMYYQSIIKELSRLGDYGFRLISSIYEKYCNEKSLYTPNAQLITPSKNKILKLVIDNTLFL